jgi:hypothetical protein
VTTPNAAGALGSELFGVSCTSSTDCTAVGSYTDGSGAELTLAEAWNGATWVIETTPNAAGALGSELFGVSCTSSTDCTAVGSYTDSSGVEVTLADAWNGTDWATQKTPNPAGSQDNQLSGVSCTAATSCTAVGQDLSGTGVQVTLADAWNGTTWATEKTPNPTGSEVNQLSGVSCTSSTACTAVGSSDGTTLPEAWNGTKWAIETSPNPPGSEDNQLSGVSCNSSTACTAVGSSEEVALSESWNGTTWVIETTHNSSGAEASQLLAVSCTSAAACTAVGSYTDSAGIGATLAEAWNGTSWTIEPTAEPTGATDGELSAVSCTAPTACEAVGSFIDPEQAEVALAEAWNGTTWVIEKTPNPAGSAESELAGVSCTSATACTAVGSSDGTMLVEVWNGTKWAIKKTPGPTGAQFSELFGASCASAVACTAVGLYLGSSGAQVPLVEAFNGTRWVTERTPVPAGSLESQLTGVSCTLATSCTAVGSYFTTSEVGVTLAEAWNGTKWGIKKSPNPTGGQFAGLSGVSCTSATACTAVGSYFTSSLKGVTLGEAWDGTRWAMETTLNPRGSAASNLSGVSCTTAACIAGGSADYEVGASAPLVESST